jgi:hypothetical protein
MSFPDKFSVLFVLAGLAFLAPGCGKRMTDADYQSVHRNAELGEIQEIFSLYEKRHQRPPRQFADLKEYQAIYQRGYHAMQEGRYVVNWGVSSQDASAVLAYEKDALSQGGTVLLGSGTIKTMSADQLRTALKGSG